MANPPQEDTQLSETLQALRSEIVESRNLTIKTDNLIKNLSADVRQIGKRQEKYEKKYVFNSVVSYVLFSVLIFAGLYLAFQAQVARERSSVDEARIRIGTLQERVSSLERELARRRDAEEQAYGLFRLLEEGKRDELLATYPTVRGKLVNRGEIALLGHEVDRINKDLAKSSFTYGLERYKGRDYEKARDAFLKSLQHVDKTDYSSELSRKLGMSLFRLQDYKGASQYLRTALRYDLNKDARNNTMYHLAVALDRLKRSAEARAVYEAYVKRFAFDKRAPLAQKRVLYFMREGVKADGAITEWED